MLKISFFILRTNDIDKTKEFYQTYFGFEFEKHTDHCTPHYASQTGGILLEIYQSKTPISPPDMIGFSGINLEDIVSRLSQDNIVKNPTVSKYGRFMIVKDPDERKIYLEAQK